MSNDINTLREALFDTMEQVKAGKMTVEQAKCIGDIAQTIVNTAKVEVDAAHKCGGRPGEFITGSNTKSIVHRIK